MASGASGCSEHDESPGALRVTLLSLVVPLAVALVLLSATRATATCPPYAPGSSFFELRARHASGAGPPSAAEVKQLIDKGIVNPLSVLPPAGPAPLTVEIRWWVYPVDNPVRVEFDVDGDGIPEWSRPGFGTEHGPRTYTYRQEGQYRFTVRVEDHGAQVRTYTAPVSVLSPAAFDAKLQSRWTTLKGALGRGDLAAALDCIHSESRSRYRKVFEALSPLSPREVDRILTTIRFVEHHGTEAIYESSRTDRGVVKSFEVRFEVDADGVWRLRMF